jgi:hypothetical protein
MNMYNKLIIAGMLALGMQAAWVGAAETPVSLAGTWRFEIAGKDADAFAHELPGTIKLPGTMDDAGLGPKNPKPPTLSGPYRLSDYAGPAWYQRDIEIPSRWAGKRVTLLLERCRWVTTVWLDGKRIGSQDSLVAPHVYDLGTDVAAGKHRLTICVDNTVKMDLGKFVSALFGGTWGNMNGIIGRIELAATPPVWLDEVQVYPDVAKKTARVKVRIGNATGTAGSGVLEVCGRNVPVTWGADGGQAEVDVPVDAPPWDEFSPNLTELTVKLGEDARTVRFGMREFAAKGTQFTMNGRPVFLRGTLECSVWPLTGYPPTDVSAWQRIYRIMKDYGLNHIRFHSWCPPEAAFAAADIEGIYIQAEGPQANVDAGEDPQRDAFIEAEFKRIVDTYGNHPSFCTMTLGNEYGGNDELLTRWVGMLIRRDPRHLYSSAASAQKTANRQWTEHGEGRGIQGPATLRDLRAIVAADTRPVVGHEVGQWTFFPDLSEIPKWHGVMALRNFEIVRDDLKRKNLLDLAPLFSAASGRFAVRLYKEEIEVLLRTPGYAGFSLLDLHDYPTQGTALIGPLNALWESKGLITPEAWRRFCSPTVPLLRMPKRTYTIDEPFEAAAELAHYGAADLAGVQAVWTIKDDKGREVAAGEWPAVNAPSGRLTALGTVKASLAKAGAPRKLTVTVALQGTEFINDWDIWVYPAAATPQPPADVVVCGQWPAAKTALAAGRKVVLFAFPQNAADFKRDKGLWEGRETALRSGLPAIPARFLNGQFLPAFWSPVWFPSQKPNTMGFLCDPEHPLFARFPTDQTGDWQWFNLMEHSRLFVLDDTPPAYRPTLQVIDNFARNHKLGIVFECRSGRGRLLVCGFDLPAVMSDPAARQFLASLYAYVGSAAFQPAHELDAARLDRLLSGTGGNLLRQLGATVRASSVARNNSSVDNLIDGDPLTAWTSLRAGAKFPHELVVEFPRPVKLAGLTCLPPVELGEGWGRYGVVKDYAVHLSDDGTTWGAPVAKGVFANEPRLQTIRFAEVREARFVKFIALSGFDAGVPFATIAELSVIPDDGETSAADGGGAADTKKGKP